MRDQRPQQRRAVVDRLDDLEVVGLEQPDQAVPEEGEVFGEDDAHGSTIARTVGPPGGLSTVERAVEGRQPSLDAAQAGAGARVGAADAVVAHGQSQLSAGRRRGRSVDSRAARRCA